MEWQNDEYPPNGTWCWVTDGKSSWIAQRSRFAAHGWMNEDTWEDWGDTVTHWIPLERPEAPSLQ